MLPSDDLASQPDFIRAAVRALADSGFSAPTTAEACVVLCDSAGWAPLVDSARTLLSQEERARAARLRFDRDRTTYILAHALWRASLAICLGVDVAEVRLTRTPAGQPRLPGTAFATSLSHSDNWIAIAICAGATIGVDIERSPPRAPLDALVPVICTPSEIADLEPLSLPEREAALLALWTRKEAALKAFGVGLTADPSKLSINPEGLIFPLPVVTSPGQATCRVSRLGLPAGVIGALAVPVAVMKVRLCRLDGADH